MDIIGKEIYHNIKYKNLGRGTITKFDEDYIYVKFDSIDKILKLYFSAEFMRLYSFNDETTVKYLNKLLIDKKQRHSFKELKNIRESANSRIYNLYNIDLSNIPPRNIVKDGILYPILICLSTRSFCIFKEHNAEIRNVIVASIDHNRDINIAAEYCFNCNEYKIDEKSLDYYETTRGKLILRKIFEVDKQKHPFSSIGWKNETLLTSYGYRVGSNGLHIYQRQRLLSYLIDNNIMSLSLVIATIRQQISMFTLMNYNKNIRANIDRQSDLEFLEEKYVVNQTPILGVLQNK